MSVRRHKQTGKWVVQIKYCHTDGRVERVFRTSPVQTRRGAEELERQIRAAILAGTYSRAREEEKPEEETKPECPTLSSFVEHRWMPVYPQAAGYRPKSLLATRWAIRHVVAVIGDERLGEVGPASLARLGASLRCKGLGEKSVKDIMGVLHKVLTTAEEWGAISRVPRFPKTKVPQAPFDHLSPEDSRSVTASARTDEERVMLLCAFQTGVRVGELVALEWCDVDWNRAELVIQRNRPSGQKETGPTKSGKPRRIPMTEELQAALKRHRHLRKLVFSQPDGSSLETWHVEHALAAACRRAEIREISPHVMRHSFISQACAAGVPLNVVQSWAGHSTIVMTMRYAHLCPDAGAKWIAALEGESGAKGQRVNAAGEA